MTGLYVQVDVSLAASPRVLRLARAAGCDDAAAEGYLARLWGVWLEHQEGDGRVTLPAVEDVEGMVRWRGEPGRLASALVAGGWLEEVEPGVWRADGWSRYEELEAKRERKRARDRAAQQRRRQRPASHGVSADVSADTDTESPRSEPEPEPYSETTSPRRNAPDSRPPPPPQPVLLEEPVALDDWPLKSRRDGTWALTEAHLAELEESYPHLDVLGECRKARQYLRDHAAKRKTRRGMRAYVSGWLNRAQDRGSGNPAAPPRPPFGPGPGGGRRPTVQEQLRDEAAALRRQAAEIRARQASDGWEEMSHAA